MDKIQDEVEKRGNMDVFAKLSDERVAEIDELFDRLIPANRTMLISALATAPCMFAGLAFFFLIFWSAEFWGTQRAVLFTVLFGVTMAILLTCVFIYKRAKRKRNRAYHLKRDLEYKAILDSIFKKDFNLNSEVSEINILLGSPNDARRRRVPICSDDNNVYFLFNKELLGVKKSSFIGLHPNIKVIYFDAAPFEVEDENENYGIKTMDSRTFVSDKGAMLVFNDTGDLVFNNGSGEWFITILPYSIEVAMQHFKPNC